MNPTDAALPLAGSTIVLGVSGGIAAYKAVELARALGDAGAHTVPVMTKAAHRFIGATTLSALCSEPVRDNLFSDTEPIPHTALGQRASLIVVAPATATVIAKYAAGIGDDLLSATLLATRAPVIVAPAMHTEMWEHASVQHNLEVLRSRGVIVVPPESGRLAGGDIGTGRLAPTASIVQAVQACIGTSGRSRDLEGVRITVTAGGTREPIDPVRVIANRSSGKMGYAVAEAAASRGASVTLLSTVDRVPPPNVTVVHVETAEQLRTAVLEAQPQADVIVMAAAVADFRPAQVAEQKIKKSGGIPEIVLEPTPDILGELAKLREHGKPVLVGFAAETNEMESNARAKLTGKGVDWLVANDVSESDAGFQVDTNRCLLFDCSGNVEPLPLQSKLDIAHAIWDRIAPTVRKEGSR